MLQYLLLLETDEERKFFTEIYKTHRNEMFRIANGILHNSADAEDAVHEAFLSLINHVDKIIDREPYQVWYYIKTTLRHRAFNMYNRKQQREEIELDEAWMQEDIFDKDVVELLEKAELQDAMINLLRSLKTPYKEVLVLQYYYEMSVQEIAEVLEKTPDNVRHIAMRARKKLESTLKENGLWNEKRVI